MIFYLSLSDGKSPQVTRTLLSIQVNFISSFPVFFSRFLEMIHDSHKVLKEIGVLQVLIIVQEGILKHNIYVVNDKFLIIRYLMNKRLS